MRTVRKGKTLETLFNKRIETTYQWRLLKFFLCQGPKVKSILQIKNKSRIEGFKGKSLQK